MTFGRLNLVVGAIGILLASLGGIMLGATYDSLFKDGHYAIDISRAYLKAGHTHGQPFAMYNLIFATLIGKVSLSDRSRKVASWSAALSMLLPIGMVLRGLTGGSMAFSPVAMIGGVGLVVSTGFLLAGSRGWDSEAK